MKITYLILIMIVLILNSCRIEPNGYKYNTGTFPATPVNIWDSLYDDYNSTSPSLGGTAPLCFSSNRNSEGNNFDVVYKLLDVIMDRKDGNLHVKENTNGLLDVYAANANLYSALNTINSQFDELGPYLIAQGDGIKQDKNGYQRFQNYILLYASNESGNFDIKLTQNLTNDIYSKPENISFLNSIKDDLYPALTSDSSAIYFCSNREGDFNIYKADLKKQNDLLSAFNDSTSRPIIKDTILSSNQNDKCPFIISNLMVFSSDRLGGFGGFDLYYSILKDGKWSEPTNFGDKINTKYDEYRPIVKTYYGEFTNDLMIFSSNRPEGKGGFDLYYVGINKMTK
jgi:hypothetical protein